MPLEVGADGTDGAALDPAVVRVRGDHPVDVDARQVDGVRRDGTGLDDPVGLDQGDPAGARAERVEVARGGVEDAVAVAVRDLGADQREVGGDGLLQQVAAAAELPRLLGR
ncbi:hypothetical protein GCM10020229_53480 [Kitasatospora albolonga]